MDGGGGGDMDTSIKSPILCCVSTREIRLDLHDGCEDSNDEEEAEEKGNPRVDTKKAAGTKGDGGGAKPARRILSLWKRRRTPKQSPAPSGDSKSAANASAGRKEAGGDPPGEGGGVFEQTALVHGPPLGEGAAVSPEEDPGALPQA